LRSYKSAFLTKSAEQLDIHRQKKKNDPWPKSHSYTKIDSKWIIDLKHQSIKLLEKTLKKIFRI
jgi:hypothetical protein